MADTDQSKTILLVEDEGIIALSETRMLQKYGYKVLAVSSGEQAVEAIQTSREIDLVLMDINLGNGMDGTQAAEIILSQRDLPLIFLTSHTDPAVVEKTEGITSFGYVVKGSGETVLDASIKMAFRLFRARQKERQKDDALRESEARWRTLVQNLPSFIAEADTDGTIIALNKVQSGFSLDDYVGKSLFEVVAPESREQFQNAFVQVLKEGKLVEYEAPGFGANREPAWYHRHLIPIIQNGEIYSILMVADDITERKQAEEKLLKSERQLQTITDTIPAYVAYVGMDDLRYRFVNNKFGESYKMPREQIIGSHIKDIIGQSNYEFAQKYLDIVRQGKSTSYENSFVTAGTERWVNVNYVPEKNDDGEVEAVVVLSFDITERKQTENKLKEREERLRMIFDTMTEGVALNECIYDENGEMVDYRVLEVNSAFYTFADYQGTQVVGNVATKLYGMTPEFIKAFWIEHKKKNATAHAEMFRPGSNKWYAIATSPFYENKFVTSFVDITGRKQVEENLSRLNERFELATRAAHLGVWDWDIKNDKLIWDDQMYVLYGIRREDFTGAYEAWLHGLHPDDRAKNDEASRQARRGEREYDTEFRVVWPDGSIHFLKAYGQVILDKDGSPERMTGVNYDITEQKQVVQALRESEARSKIFFEQANDAIHITNAKGQLIEVNQRLCEMMGYTREQLLKMRISDLQAPERRINTNVIQTELERYGDSLFEGLNIHRDGRRIPVEISVSRIDNPQGELFVSIVRDITERVEAEKALRNKTQELDLFFTSSLDLLCVADVGGYFRRLNPEWENTLGYSLAELKGKSFLDFVHPDDVDATLKAMNRLESQETILNFENRYRCKDGSYRWIEWRSVPADKLIYASAHDITERKQVEETLQNAFKVKQTLLRELQHRAKNSFYLISSLTNLMADTSQSEEVSEALTELGERVNALAELYNLLYITEAVTETHLEEYLAKITTSIPSSQNIRFEQRYDSVVIPVKTAASLGLILTELITNAIKHAFPENRPGTIRIALHKTRIGAQLEVNDDGMGLPENFDMSASNSLGLMIVSSLAREIHGTFLLKSGQGTQCTLEFPVE